MKTWPVRYLPDPTGARRDRARRDPAFLAEQMRLARHAPGGSPDRPISVISPSEVEIRASSMRCPVCHGAQRADDHVVHWLGDLPLRVATARCKHCGLERRIYFRVDGIARERSARPTA